MHKFSKFINQAVLSLACVSLIPVQALSAYSGDMCCEEECCPSICESKAFTWIGSALIGAAAGAGAGYAAGQGNRGHRGYTGATGPAGPIGLTGPTGATGAPGTFAVDTGETLTFNTALTVTVGIGAVVTPFVSQPDGTVLVGTPVTVAALGLIAFPPFVIADPQFGEYSVGVQVDSSIIGLTGSLVENAVATRDSSTTTFESGAAVVILLGTQGQTSADFVYGPPIVP